MSSEKNSVLIHVMVARSNLETVISDEAERNRAANALAACAMFDTSRRLAFHDRYAHLTNRGSGFNVANEYPDDPLAGGIIDLHTHVAQHPETIAASGFWDGRDISVELAAVSQLGDWKKGGGLDDELRTLPSSKLLADNGLTFTNTFDHPSNAFIRYRFAASGGILLARRSRAAGDVSHSDKTELKIVKQSQFAIDETALSTTAATEARFAAHRYEEVYRSDDDDRTVKLATLKQRMAEIGQELVEPYVQDASMRNKNVLPVSSQYFALYHLEPVSD